MRFFQPAIPEIGIDELETLRAEGRVVILDVREPWEYRAGHVPDVIHIPMGQLVGRTGELPRDRPIMVICQSGHRSLGVTEYLLARGFQGAASVAGGTGAWADSGREIETGG